MRDIGKNIKELRQQKNMTQDELAEKLFVTRQTVSNYETGKSRPDIEMLTRIAETLETDPNTVLYGIPQKVNRERMILKLCISAGLLVIALIGYACLADLANEIAATTYKMGLSIVCRIFAGPMVAFLFGWTVMQALGVFAKLLPLQDPWGKRLRRITFGTTAGYLLLVFPLLLMFGLGLDIGDILLRVHWHAANWIAGYVYGMIIRPNCVLFGLLGGLLWLGIPQKIKE